MSLREGPDLWDAKKINEIEKKQSPVSLQQKQQQHQQQELQEQQQQQQKHQEEEQQHRQQHHQKEKESEIVEVEHNKGDTKVKTDENERSLKRDFVDKVERELSTKQVRRSSTEQYRCVTCQTSFEFSQDLLEHLAEPSSSSSEKSDVDRKRSCLIRECFICDFVPDSRLADKYRSLQDHVITAHFKARLHQLTTQRLPRSDD